MKNRSIEKTTALAAGVVTIPVASLLFLWGVPGVLSPVTFAALCLVAFGGAYVALNTWRNGQATENIGHVLQRAEAVAPNPDAPNAAAPRSRA